MLGRPYLGMGVAGADFQPKGASEHTPVKRRLYRPSFQIVPAVEIPTPFDVDGML